MSIKIWFGISYVSIVFWDESCAQIFGRPNESKCLSQIASRPEILLHTFLGPNYMRYRS